MKLLIKPLEKREIAEYLAVPDLTNDQSHAIGQLYQKIYTYIRDSHPTSEVRVYRPNPIVSVTNNYDRLLIAKDNLSRSSTYTHYVTNDTILRTHTSACIPDVLKELATDPTWDDVVILLPGLVYRRDVTDKKHLGVIHQMDMWRVVRNSTRTPIVKQDLVDVVTGVAKTCGPHWNLRIVESPHPYTRGGIEVNLVKGDQDIEILECGLINDQLLLNAGLDPAEYSGWASGMGLDRLTMILKDIPDIRYLRSTNEKIAIQMKNLLPYVEISHQPALKRDLSYCVPVEHVEEDINEDIRRAMGNEVDILESVEILSTTSYNELPENVRTRLGCTPELKNILVRITLRHLSKTLTKEEGNSLYEKIYRLVNKGAAGYI
jgi:phenylalanyl-tRNA synthetase alpha chain